MVAIERYWSRTVVIYIFFPFWLGCRLLFNIFLFPPSTAKFLGGIKKHSAGAAIFLQHPYLTHSFFLAAPLVHVWLIILWWILYDLHFLLIIIFVWLTEITSRISNFPHPAALPLRVLLPQQHPHSGCCSHGSTPTQGAASFGSTPTQGAASTVAFHSGCCSTVHQSDDDLQICKT